MIFVVDETRSPVSQDPLMTQRIVEQAHTYPSSILLQVLKKMLHVGIFTWRRNGHRPMRVKRFVLGGSIPPGQSKGQEPRSWFVSEPCKPKNWQLHTCVHTIRVRQGATVRTRQQNVCAHGAHILSRSALCPVKHG